MLNDGHRAEQIFGEYRNLNICKTSLQTVLQFERNTDISREKTLQGIGHSLDFYYHGWHLISTD